MLSYNRGHHKVQEKQEHFCIGSQDFLSACEDRAANVSCGTSGRTWIQQCQAGHPLLFLQLVSGNPAELKSLQNSGRWHMQR